MVKTDLVAMANRNTLARLYSERIAEKRKYEAKIIGLQIVYGCITLVGILMTVMYVMVVL